MRRNIASFLGLAVAVMGVVACEDGPSQTYSAEPAGAGNVINGPGNGAILPDAGLFVPPATQAYEAGVGGQNASQLCTAAQQKQVWNNNFNAPIIVPGLAGGLDIAGGAKGSNGIAGFDPQCLSYENCQGMPLTPKYNPMGTPPYWDHPVYNPVAESWTGMTVEQAETLLCQPFNATAIFGGNYPQLNWGEQGEFGVLYSPASRIISAFILLQGYNGLLEATNSKTNTTYTVSMQNQFMTKQVGTGTPQPITLNWDDGSNNAFMNDIYEAMRQTFIPDFPADVDCVAAAHCQINNNGIDDGILIFTPLNLAIFVATTIGTPSAVSIPLLIQVGALKVLPFSDSSVTLQLDPAGVGPTAVTKGLGGSDGGVGTDTCNYHLGMLYGDPNTPGTFEHDCIYTNPGGTSNLGNQVSQAKILGGLQHDDEAYIFSTVGVDPQFAAHLAPGAVVSDGELPGPNDVAYELTVDANLIGTIANDFTDNDSTKPKDFHGIGLVTLEWANIVQQYMKLNYGVTAELGDPACIANPVRPPLPDGGTYPAGTKICSGIEGIVTTAPPSLLGSAPASWANNALGAAGVTVDMVAGTQNPMNTPCSTTSFQAGTCATPLNGISVGLAPSTWFSIFCSDAGGLDGTGTPIGYQNCLGNVFGDSYYFDTMQDAIAVSFAGTAQSPGNFPVPNELADRRFFFQQWILAMVKYLQSAGDPTTPIIAPAGMPSIDANIVDPNSLFFDNYNGSGSGFEFGQYDDTLTVNSQKQAPTAFTVVTNLLTGGIGQFSFDRYNFRGDTAIFQAFTDTASDQPGAETVYLQNLTGSPVLQNVYGQGSGGYACAIATTSAAVTAAGCTTPPAPVDGFGNPLYLPYADAFGTTIPAVGDGGSPSVGTTIFNIPAFESALEGQPSGITIDSGPYTLIQSAMVTLPIFSPPSSYQGAVPTGTKTVSELLPFLSGATVGFPVTIDGSRDKFYNTLNVDFTAGSVTGQPVNFNMDYEYSGTDILVRAIETQNFFGQVFVCSEANPKVQGATDVLGIRMYDNGATILEWIAQHPTSTLDCGIQIKFSIYGNYADYISFGVNPGQSIAGARIGLNPGFGGSVVSEATIFDPNIVASLGM